MDSVALNRTLDKTRQACTAQGLDPSLTIDLMKDVFFPSPVCGRLSFKLRGHRIQLVPAQRAVVDIDSAAPISEHAMAAFVAYFTPGLAADLRIAEQNDDWLTEGLPPARETYHSRKRQEAVI